MTFKLEVGKSYKREDGEKVIIDKIIENKTILGLPSTLFIGDNGRRYSIDGFEWLYAGELCGDELCLVAEWQDEHPCKNDDKCQGTGLRQLMGDRVCKCEQPDLGSIEYRRNGETVTKEEFIAPDWSLAGPGAVATLRGGMKIEIKEYSKSDNLEATWPHWIVTEGYQNNYKDNGTLYSPQECVFDIIHIEPAKVDESPVRYRPQGYDYRTSYQVTDDLYWAMERAFSLASTDLPTYQRVLEQMKGVK